MKDANWQQVLHDPAALRADIRAHLEAENAYTAAVLADTGASALVVANAVRLRRFT